MSTIFVSAKVLMGKHIGHVVTRGGGGGANISKMLSGESTVGSEMSVQLFSRWKVDQLNWFFFSFFFFF